MAVNITAIKISSSGVWQGDNPLNFAFPLLIIQTILVLLLSRSLALLFKPLRQPKVIAEIVGGILLGPSALGRNQAYMQRVFPAWSTTILESVANIGLIFFLFIVGLDLDLRSMQRSGRRALSIATAGIVLPFTLGIGIAFILRRSISGEHSVGYAAFIVFIGVALSITAFPVLARILAELKLLNTPLGETAMAAAAFNDVAAWILLALAIAISGGDHHKSPLVSLLVLASGVVFVLVEMILVKPVMAWVAKRAEGREAENEIWISLTMAGVLVSGFMTDMIGIHSIFGAFVFGLTVPKEGEFAGKLIDRIEDFVTGLLLPLYFASSGLKTNVATISGGKAWGLVVLVITVASAGKIIGTFLVALGCKMTVKEAFTLGVIMNTKGLVELIVLNIGKEKKVLNDEAFAIMVVMALFTTFLTTPAVMAIYKPARYNGRRVQQSTTHPCDELKEFRVLACVHGNRDVSSLINFIEMIRGGIEKSALKLYVLHLVELTERFSSIIMARASALPFGCASSAPDSVSLAFETYGQLGRVNVRQMKAVSAMSSMHEEVFRVAGEKQASLVVVPLVENMGVEWRAVKQRVLEKSPCTVAVLVDRGLIRRASQEGTEEVGWKVCVVFFGGPDDREVLQLAGRMVEHPGVELTVMRFVKSKEEYCEKDVYTFSTADKEKVLLFFIQIVIM
ncbi:Cation/H+ exchanger domain-containing protein [Dioscorea alata]|uniref:Cation/H+ exchanger domain-containing protein n=1 Tax=Dioscorea alata TaxID=55571 RepID=A0ACB7V383_DIOAL|nr:Cation/H+ exchanger domain-containing protein [Dioscorea alata]